MSLPPLPIMPLARLLASHKGLRVTMEKEHGRAPQEIYESILKIESDAEAVILHQTAGEPPMQITRDERNNPVFNFPFDLPVTRNDNTLVIIDAIIAEFRKEDGTIINVGADIELGADNTPIKADFCLFIREPSGANKAYTTPLSVLAGAVLAHHDLSKNVSHLRPVTSADIELEREQEDEALAELSREPTEEELADASATIPPSINQTEEP